MRLSDFDHFAREHHGLITLTASQLSNDSWRRAVRAGSLIELHRHVARLPGTDPSILQRIHAAVLAGGETAMASHHSAAVLWGLIELDDPFTHITLGDPSRHPRPDGVVVHRPRDRQDLRPSQRMGIACTGPLRTLADLGGSHPALVEAAVGKALTAGIVSLDALDATVIEHGRRGRPGIRWLRAATDRWRAEQPRRDVDIQPPRPPRPAGPAGPPRQTEPPSPASLAAPSRNAQPNDRPGERWNVISRLDRHRADRVLARAFTDLVRCYDLPPVTSLERICGWEIDFRFVDTPVLIECAAWSIHGLDQAQYERDRRKGLDLAAAGWQLLRLSHRSVVCSPGETAALLRRSLQRWNQVDEPLLTSRRTDPKHIGLVTTTG